MLFYCKQKLWLSYMALKCCFALNQSHRSQLRNLLMRNNDVGWDFQAKCLFFVLEICANNFLIRSIPPPFNCVAVRCFQMWLNYQLKFEMRSLTGLHFVFVLKLYVHDTDLHLSLNYRKLSAWVRFSVFF